MLKTTRSFDESALIVIGIDVNKIISGVGDLDPILLKSKILAKSKNHINVGATGCLTFKAKVTFTWFRHSFTKTPILWYINLEYHIQIETDAFCCAIDGVLSHLTFDQMILKPK